MAITLTQSSWAVGIGSPIGVPTNSCYIYLDQATANVYLYVNFSWQLIFNLIGNPGNQGLRGASWFVGVTPIATLALANAQLGDFYLFQTGMIIYQYNGTIWLEIGPILGIGTQGPPGTPGAAGSPGSVWYAQVTQPLTANINDMWLNVSSFNIYQYQATTFGNLTSANWIQLCNIGGSLSSTVDASSITVIPTGSLTSITLAQLAQLVIDASGGDNGLLAISLTDQNGSAITDDSGSNLIVD